MARNNKLSEISFSAIITAAGKGSRMNLDTKKQFLRIHGKPIIVYSLEKFINTKIFTEIIITTAKKDVEYLSKILFSEFDFSQELVKIVSGGKTRQESVFKGMEASYNREGVIVIHDGVRPFVKEDEIKQIAHQANHEKAVTLAIPVKNTIKKVENGKAISTLPRESLWETLTPQAFRFNILYDAHSQAQEKKIKTNDDAELVEKLFMPVHIQKGFPENIKITTQFDLKIAEELLKRDE